MGIACKTQPKVSAAAARDAVVHQAAACMPPATAAHCPLPPSNHYQWRHAVCAAASSTGSGSNGGFARTAKQLMQEQRGKEPWYIGFQTNERNLHWEDAATLQMTKLYVAQKSGKDVAWVDEQLAVLAVLLPDIVAKLGRMKADLVLALASDTQGVAQRLIQLQELLPGVDLSRLSARYPALLLEHTPAGVAQHLDELRAALPEGTAVARLVEREPVLLDVDIGQVLREIRRIMPGSDPAKVLLRDPTSVLDMQAFKMGSSLQDTQ